MQSYDEIIEAYSKSEVTLDLAGVVCYYGMHYSMAFRHQKKKKWLYLDDSIVREVGQTWFEVKKQMVQESFCQI